MSFSAFGPALADFDAWMAVLRPASFRGVPFLWDGTEFKGGRRLVTHEFPGRDNAYTEDMGRKDQRYTIRAFVIGADYSDQRDALESACQDYDDAAILMHPTRGPIQCRAGLLASSETKERGGMAALTLEFVEDGPLPSPLAGDDTASTLLAGVDSLQDVLADSYEALSEVTTLAQYTLGLASLLLDLAALACAALPPLTIAGLGPQIAAIGATPSDDAATASAVISFANAAAAQVVAAYPFTSATPADPIVGEAVTIAQPADPTGGLAALATFGSTLAPPAGAGPSQAAQAAQQAAVLALVQGAALSALLAVFAQVDWPDANAATEARSQALALIDAQIQASADAGADALYLAWHTIEAQVVAFLVAEAQALPAIVPYATGESAPSLALAYRWYQDASRASGLDELNDAPHPAFMPVAGVRLSV